MSGTHPCDNLCYYVQIRSLGANIVMECILVLTLGKQQQEGESGNMWAIENEQQVNHASTADQPTIATILNKPKLGMTLVQIWYSAQIAACVAQVS